MTQNPVLAKMTPDHVPVVAWVDNDRARSSSVSPSGSEPSGTCASGSSAAGASPEQPDARLSRVDAKGNIWVAWLEDGQARVWMSNY